MVIDEMKKKRKIDMGQKFQPLKMENFNVSPPIFLYLEFYFGQKFLIFFFEIGQLKSQKKNQNVDILFVTLFRPIRKPFFFLYKVIYLVQLGTPPLGLWPPLFP